MWTHLLMRGELKGWSNFGFLGEPVGDLYPFVLEAWVAAARGLTLGLLSWETTYCVAFLGFYALSAWALYDFGRRHLSPIAGAVAALLWVLDPGAWEQGGWTYHLTWGVWGQSLGTALGLLALSRWLDHLRHGRPKDLAMAGLLGGLTVLSHPIHLIVGAGAVGVILLLRVGEASRRLQAPALALAVAGGWWIPMVGRSDWMRRISGEGVAPVDLVHNLALGVPFEGGSAGVGLLFLVGAVVALRSVAGRVVVAAFVGLALLWTRLPIDLLQLDRLSAAFDAILYERFSIPAKVAFFLLAGEGARALLARLDDWGHPDLGRAAGALLAAGALSWGSVALLAQGERVPADWAALSTPQNATWWDDYQQYLRWSREAKRNSRDFYRIAYDIGRHNHRMMAATLYNNTPILKIGYPPAMIFRNIPEVMEPGLFPAASVRYVVADRDVQSTRYKLIERFGVIRVYEDQEFQSRLVTVSGPGRARVVRLDDERVDVQVSGSDPRSDVILHLAAYPRWRAFIGDHELPIASVPLWNGGSVLGMSVPAQNGVIVFTYGRQALDWIGIFASAVGVVALLRLLWVGRRAGVPG